MASPRADAADVIAITCTDLDAGIVQILLEDAALWVANNLVGVCGSLPDDKIEPIERYLAAAFVVGTDEAGGQLIEAARGDIRERYAEREDAPVAGVEFIRRAAAYDPCGIILERFLGKPRARAVVGPGFRSR